MSSIRNLGDGLLIKLAGVTDIESLISLKGIPLINFFIGFAALVAVIILIVAGYLFITSAGDQEKVAKAQKAITGAVIGLIIVFLARAIVFFVVDIGKPGPLPGGGGGGGKKNIQIR